LDVFPADDTLKLVNFAEVLALLELVDLVPENDLLLANQ
jgi:hypothetical protein